MAGASLARRWSRPASDEINDRPVRDGGGNYGRLARVKEGLVTDFVSESLHFEIAGIAAVNGVKFFGAFVDAKTPDELQEKVDSMVTSVAAALSEGEIDEARAFCSALRSGRSPTT